MSRIQIRKGPIELAGLVWKPGNVAKKCPALIVVHPGGGIKEQTASLYSKKLSEQGYVTICYDAAYQGESGGGPHFLEDPTSRVSDIFAVVPSRHSTMWTRNALVSLAFAPVEAIRLQLPRQTTA